MSGPRPEPLAVAIVGAGRIAGGYDEEGDRTVVRTHAGAYAAHAGFRLVACVDPDASARESFARRWNVPQSFADLGACLAEAKPDVVSVCSPTATHEAVLAALLDWPVKGVRAEKPAARAADRLGALADRYALSGKALVVNYLRRFDPAMAALREEIGSGAIGRVRSVTAFYSRGILNNGSHAVDLVSWLLDAPLEVHSARVARYDLGDDDPTIDALLTAGDVPVHLVGADGGDYSLFEIEIMAERQAVTIEDSGFRMRRRAPRDSRRFRGHRQLDDGLWEGTGLDKALLGAVDGLHRAVSGGVAPASSGRTATRTLQTVDAVKRCAGIAA